MQIRIKPEVIKSSNGFDFIGRPVSYQEMKRAVSDSQNQCQRQYSNQGAVVYVAEKHRRTKIVENTFTKTGKVSKKTITKLIPTHWRYTVYFIPKAVVDILKQNKCKIVQKKHYYDIVSTKV